MIEQPTEKLNSHNRAENRNNSAGVQHRLHVVLDGNFTLLNITIIIPNYNEAVTIATVVADFQKCLPTASIYVYDNNSRGDTVSRAMAAGAIDRSEPRQGKGYVVRRMFADIEADLYVLVDGDDTYDATVAHQLVDKLARENLDMVNGARIEQESTVYRPGHKFGNRLQTGLVRIIFSA